MKLGFAGMGHLGLVMSSVLTKNLDAESVCFDCSGSNSDELLEVFYEPGLKELIKANGDKQQFTGKVTELQDCDVVYITVDVDDHSDLESFWLHLNLVTFSIKDTTPIIIVSQVPVGTCRKVNESRRNPIYYQVDNLVFGRSLSVAGGKDSLVVGVSHPDDTIDVDRLNLLFDKFDRDRDVIFMSYENAELYKMAVNCYLASSIAMSNALASVCVGPHMDWFTVQKALHREPRIGPNAYLLPTPMIGGGHLMRDVKSASALVENVYATDGGVASYIVPMIDNVTVGSPNYRLLSYYLNSCNQPAIWGLAYKARTNSVEDSFGMLLYKKRKAIPCHDYLVKLPDVCNDNPLSILQGCDGLLIATPHHDYYKIKLSDIYERLERYASIASSIGRYLKKPTLIDPYRVYDPDEAISMGFNYHTLGKRSSL